MLSFVISSTLLIFFSIMVVYFTIKALIKNTEKNNKYNLAAAVCSAMLGLITYSNVNVPMPTIYPLNNDTQRYGSEAEISIECNDFFDVYYSLDGKDPKEGNKYENSFIITGSTTISARNKFLFWWSEISKSVYIFENISQSDNEIKEEIVQPTITSMLDSTIKPTPTNTSIPTNIPTLTNTPTPIATPSPIQESSSKTVTPFVVSSPIQDTVTNAYLENWEETDVDIIGNTYSSAMKLSVYNLINKLGGGSSNIVADVHIPFGEKFDETWIFNFVVAKDMIGNGSSAKVTILSGGEELFPTFTIDSVTTDEIVYKIELKGIRDLIIRFDCKAVGDGICVGIVYEKE